jgi:hypothetical protein
MKTEFEGWLSAFALQRRLACWASLTVQILCAGGLEGAIIPDDRRIVWDGGIPGGVPSRTVIFANVRNPPFAAKGDGLTDDTEAMQKALDACPSNQVVYVPTGVYKITRQLRVPGGKTLRGAGPARTEIRYLGLGEPQILAIRENTWIPYTTNILAGYAKGSTLLRVAGASGFKAGDMVLVDQLNDGVLVNKNGLQGCDYCSREEGNRAMGQIVMVEARQGDELTISPGLYWTHTESLLPQATRLDFTTRWAGVEDLKVVNGSGGAEYNILMESAGYCWLKNVESSGCRRRHVWTYYAFRCEIRDCYFHDAQSSYGPDHGYGVLLGSQSSANLVENNIFNSLHVPMQNDSGSSGNVWSYNYVTNVLYDDPEWLQPDASTHGAHPMMNLWEGNSIYKIYTDWIHGSASHNTYFRNYARGWQAGNVYGNNAFGAEKQNTHMNVVGNVFGTFGRSDIYQLARAKRRHIERTIYELGYTTIGDDGPDGDATVEATLLRHGNFDYVSRSVVWAPGIPERVLPASLYLTHKPAWWGNLPWPPFGPDLNPIVNKLPAQVRFGSILSGSSRPAPPVNLRVNAP